MKGADPQANGLEAGTRRQTIRPSLSALTEPKAYELNSVRNALRILSLLREVNEVGVSDAAQSLGLGMSTAHRLLTTLRAQGYVRQCSSTRKYRLGPAIEGLRAATVYDDYVELAMDSLDWLRDETQETVHLAVLSHDNVHFLAASESPRALRVGSREGGMLPAHCTSIGKALLAALPKATLGHLYPADRLIGLTKLSCRSRQSLEAELARARRAGYARNIGESEDGVAALAMVVREANGIPALSVAVSAPQARLRLSDNPQQPSQAEAAVLQKIARAVRRIEAALAP